MLTTDLALAEEDFSTLFPRPISSPMGDNEVESEPQQDPHRNETEMSMTPSNTLDNLKEIVCDVFDRAAHLEDSARHELVKHKQRLSVARCFSTRVRVLECWFVMCADKRERVARLKMCIAVCEEVLDKVNNLLGDNVWC